MEMKVKLNWLEESNKNNVCLLSKKIFRLLKLSEKVEYSLFIGQKRRKVYFKPTEHTEDCIYLIPQLFDPSLTKEDLAGFEGYRINLWVKGEDLHLGPVLGIFVKPKRLQKPLYKNTVLGHMEAGLAEGFLCYFFSIDSVDWEKSRIKGFTLLPGTDKWTFRWFPIPDVIYDRGAGFNTSEKAKVKEIREKLREELKVPFINNLDQIGKWKTYSQLSKYEEVTEYFPMTIRYKNFNDLLIMLKQHGFIFLKAIYGSKGKQVMSIEKIDKKYKLIFLTDHMQELVLNDVKELREHIMDYTSDKKYVIQEGIRLLKYKERLFDMRILVIKDKMGRWRAISNYVKIAKSRFSITNYSLGGECDLYENIYPNLSSPLSNRSIPDYEDIASAATKIAEIIDKEFGTFGELGIDMGIDEHGKLWLIEVNTKPDKDLVDGLDDFNDINPQYSAIFEYTKYICQSK
ncbi:YheC/YheD family protein [Bacillus shivajii]|uniref:YheC/YheD family endospore coat-associated protein n=1 Tax=Bacillus shivajii TaxID=1983719 RepID=UPI001CFBEE97|nr:YheC/YheD family protein [Bacillus shivajii]UCZ52609.1 YheC/YheD family protein [Bacillus shivajii]